jgi:hypothetical protein
VGFPTQIEAFWKSERFKRPLYRTSCELAQSQTLRFAKKANTSGGGQVRIARHIRKPARAPPGAAIGKKSFRWEQYHDQRE